MGIGTRDGWVKGEMEVKDCTGHKEHEILVACACLIITEKSWKSQTATRGPGPDPQDQQLKPPCSIGMIWVYFSRRRVLSVTAGSWDRGRGKLLLANKVCHLYLHIVSITTTLVM